MATFTNQAKNNASYANQNKSTVGSLVIPAGTAIGLLLALTYAVDTIVSAGSAPTWTKQIKN